MDSITAAVLALASPSGTFKVSANRADKTFPLNSMELSAELGGKILDNFPDLKVDLHNPDFVIHADLRETARPLVYRDVVKCSMACPVGTSGKGLLLLSGVSTVPFRLYDGKKGNERPCNSLSQLSIYKSTCKGKSA